jgi:hypothetical protein
LLNVTFVGTYFTSLRNIRSILGWVQLSVWPKKSPISAPRKMITVEGNLSDDIKKNVERPR